MRRNFDPEFRILPKRDRLRPSRWLRRTPPSAVKHLSDPAWRCARCGRWPDQRTGITGDWLIEPVMLCPGCHERVMFKIKGRWPDGGMDLAEAVQILAASWPKRGLS